MPQQECLVRGRGWGGGQWLQLTAAQTDGSKPSDRFLTDTHDHISPPAEINAEHIERDLHMTLTIWTAEARSILNGTKRKVHVTSL